VQLLVKAWSWNLVLIGLAVSESKILQFLYFGVLAWNSVFPPLGGGVVDIYPQMWSPIVLTPKRRLLARKHVVWPINRENRSSGSTSRKKVKIGQFPDTNFRGQQMSVCFSEMGDRTKPNFHRTYIPRCCSPGLYLMLDTFLHLEITSRQRWLVSKKEAKFGTLSPTVK